MARFKYFLPARLIYRSDSGWHSKVGSASPEKQPEREKYYDEMADVATRKKSKEILDSMSKKKDGLGYATIEDVAKVDKLERKVESYKNSLFLTLKEFFKKVDRVKSASDPEKAAEKEAFLSLKFLVDNGFNVDLLYPGDLIIIENGNLYIKTGTKLRVNGLPLRPDYRAAKKEIKEKAKDEKEKIKGEVTVELTPTQKDLLKNVEQFLEQYEKFPKESLDVMGEKYQLFKDKQHARLALEDFVKIDESEAGKLLKTLNKIIFDALVPPIKPVDKNTRAIHEKLLKFESYSFLTKAEFLGESADTKNLKMAFEKNYLELEDFSKKDPSKESLDSGKLNIFETAYLTNYLPAPDPIRGADLIYRSFDSKLVKDLQKRIVEKQGAILDGIIVNLSNKLPSTKFEPIRKGKDPLDVYDKYPIADLRYITAVFEKNPWVYEYLTKSENHSTPIALKFEKALLGEYKMAREFSEMIKTALKGADLKKKAISDRREIEKMSKDIDNETLKFIKAIGGDSGDTEVV